jgi:hypothetical protein
VKTVRPWSAPEEVDSGGWNLERYTKEIVKDIINHPNNIEAVGYLWQRESQSPVSSFFQFVWWAYVWWACGQDRRRRMKG